MRLRTLATAGVLSALLATSHQAQSRFASYSEVSEIIATVSSILPADLAGTAPAESWGPWVERHDRAIRDRLQRGDEETIVNWLAYGTSFTKLPRIALDRPTESGAATAKQAKLIAARAADLASALAAPGADERRLFARELFQRQGYATASAADRARLADRLVDLVYSVTSERAAIAREGQAIRKAGDVSAQFAARSRLFRDRGLSLDTSFRPSVALEQAMAQLQQKGVLKAGAIRDVAVIAPGLDFTDKSSGYDFYPQQTLQPFALVDSLLRLGLVGDSASVRVTTLDISPRVNDHLVRSRKRAAAGEPYVIRLPLERDVKWKPVVAQYWRSAGDRIGAAAPPRPSTVGGTRVDVRTISVRPAVVLCVEPMDLNVVLQRSDQHRFDLVVATNVFIYYDTLEQVLALSNVKAMLKPGGLLLSNNALLELPSSGIRSIGYITVEYSDIQDDGDHIVWYRSE